MHSLARNDHSGESCTSMESKPTSGAAAADSKRCSRGEETPFRLLPGRMASAACITQLFCVKHNPAGLGACLCFCTVQVVVLQKGCGMAVHSKLRVGSRMRHRRGALYVLRLNVPASS